MTVHRMFKCNLCQNVIDADCHGYGIHFRPGGIDMKCLHETEHHLCTDCGSHLMAAFAVAEFEVDEKADTTPRKLTNG